MATFNRQERRFFDLVTRAVLANPFGDNRRALDLKIAGLYTDDKLETATKGELDQAMEEVGARLRHLDRKRSARIDDFSGPDQRLISYAFLFDIFHRYSDHFDDLIERQLKAGERSLKVGFAAEMLALLETRGFSNAEACRYFELSFQSRRAYYFIQTRLVGCSPCMQRLRESLWNNVFTQDTEWYDRYLWNRMEDFSTLILGATGTGKGTAAAAIGRSGYIPFDRDQGCFVESFTRSFTALNLSQFSETLIESELFGHRKGAFTGAVGDYQGVFDRCSPFGAIFLDEIGEVSEPIQIKLLQVIQERIYRPVGGHETRRFAGRVIAATNRDLATLRRSGRMRDDFFYRLCSDIIILPRLQQRIIEDPQELRAMLAHIVAHILGAPVPELLDTVETLILRQPGLDYDWPGNVRELEQCVRRILLNRCYYPSETQVPDGLLSDFQRDVAAGRLDAADLLGGYCRMLYDREGTYEAVARLSGLDRRTVKKHIDQTKS